MRSINTIPVVSSDGTKEEVLVYQEVVSMATKDDPHAIRHGKKTAMTRSGQLCRYVNHREFEIVSTGERLTRC